MLENFPKMITLRDGHVLTLRLMNRDDQFGLYEFFISLPLEDRRYLRNDVTDRKVIENWVRNLDYDKVVPVLAEDDGRIVANATLHWQTFGWGRHVGEIRITIHPEFQGRGLGIALLDEISDLAAQSGVKKLLARIVSTRAGTITAFEKAGFSQVTVLPPAGQQFVAYHDQTHGRACHGEVPRAAAAIEQDLLYRGHPAANRRCAFRNGRRALARRPSGQATPPLQIRVWHPAATLHRSPPPQPRNAPRRNEYAATCLRY